MKKTFTKYKMTKFELAEMMGLEYIRNVPERHLYEFCINDNYCFTVYCQYDLDDAKEEAAEHFFKEITKNIRIY